MTYYFYTSIVNNKYKLYLGVYLDEINIISDYVTSFDSKDDVIVWVKDMFLL